jgi:hypothetical protein
LENYNRTYFGKIEGVFVEISNNTFTNNPVETIAVLWEKRTRTDGYYYCNSGNLKMFKPGNDVLIILAMILKIDLL